MIIVGYSNTSRSVSFAFADLWVHRQLPILFPYWKPMPASMIWPAQICFSHLHLRDWRRSSHLGAGQKVKQAFITHAFLSSVSQEACKSRFYGRLVFPLSQKRNWEINCCRHSGMMPMDMKKCANANWKLSLMKWHIHSPNFPWQFFKMMF